MAMRDGMDDTQVMLLFEALVSNDKDNLILDGKKRVAEEIRQVASGSTAFSDRSGTLRASLKSTKAVKSNKKKQVSVVAGKGSTDEPVAGDPYYARWVEFGHGGPRPAPPKRFMQQAAQEVESRAVTIFNDGFVEGLKRIADKSMKRAR